MNSPDIEDVRRRAYEIWLAEGRPEGRDRAHWFQALAELGGGTREDPDLPGSPGTGADATQSFVGEEPFRGGPLETRKPPTDEAS